MTKPALLRRPLDSATAKRIVRRGAQVDAVGPRAQRVSYDAATDRLVIELQRGYTFAVPRRALGGPLTRATPAALRDVRIEGRGSALFWPALDDGFDLMEVLSGVLGTHIAATALGRRGGASRSPAKAASARANGARGGRPRVGARS